MNVGVDFLVINITSEKKFGFSVMSHERLNGYFVGFT